MRWYGKKAFFFVLAGLLLLGISSRVVHAQMHGVMITRAIQREDDVFLYFDAFDSEGEAITDITSQQVSLSVGPHAMQIDAVDPLGLPGERMATVLVLDTAYAYTQDELARLNEALLQWVEIMRPEELLAIVTYGPAVTVSSDFLSNKEVLTLAVQHLLYAPGGEAPLYDALARAAQLIDQSADILSSKITVAVITDGMDSGSSSALEQCLAQFKRQGAALYIAGLGDALESLDTLAFAAQEAGVGGFIMSAVSGEDAFVADQALAKLHRRIHHSYRLRFSTMGAAFDGSTYPMTLTQLTEEGRILAEPFSAALTSRAAEPEGALPEAGEDTAPEASPEPTPLPSGSPLGQWLQSPVARFSALPAVEQALFLATGAVALILLILLISSLRKALRRRKHRRIIRRMKRAEQEAMRSRQQLQLPAPSPGPSVQTNVVMRPPVHQSAYPSRQGGMDYSVSIHRVQSVRATFEIIGLKQFANTANILSAEIHNGFTIGSHESCSLRLSDPSVAPQHACICITPSGTLQVRVLEPSSSVYVNRVRVQLPHPLKSGDMIRVGHITLMIQYDLPARKQRADGRKDLAEGDNSG